MASRFRVLLPAVLAVATTTGAECGGGAKVNSSTVPDLIEVLVSAGSPVAGALVTVYAIDDSTGQVSTGAGAGGVLGSAGPTDASGRVTVSLRGYSGPVRVVASGPALFYVDPTSPPDGTGASPVIQVPSSFALTTFVAGFKGGTAAVVPVTLYTTLADHAALAWARGLHSSHPGRSTLTEALAARDRLFVTHITKAGASWDPGALRTTVPAQLGKGAQSLVDAAFAGLFDIGMNQLAKDTAQRAGYGSGAGGLTAPTLLQLLEDDLDADGRLDGAGAAGRAIRTAGATPVLLDADFLRTPLAVALLAWVRDAQLNRSGISDADLAGALVFKSLTEDISDLFGPAPTQPFDPLDREPPRIAFTAAPPAYTNRSTLDLSVDARDAHEVRGVFAQVGGRREAGVFQDGAWRISTRPLNVGHNTVIVWAEDSAQPAPNSGLGLEPPYQLVIDVLYDPDAPTAAYDSAFASYADERGMTPGVGADGIALVPAAYSIGAKVAIPGGGEIFKAATRLSAGGSADAAELEGSNAANVPVLRFAVPFNPRTDAPISTARYRIEVTCPTCGPVPAATGDLLPSPTVAPQALYFYLPLSTETVPALASLAGAATLAVSLDLADAAGNPSTVGGFSFTFHVIGPPLAVTEDAAYAGYGDLRSTFPYRVVGASAGVDTYSTLWDGASPNFFGGAVRLVRYVVSNPSPEPVAVTASFAQTPGGSWRMEETWPRQSYNEEPRLPVLSDPSTAVPYVIDGFVFYQAHYWLTPYGSTQIQLAKTETWPFPCPGGHAGGYAAHRMGDTANKYLCAPGSPSGPTETAVFSTADVTPQVFAGFQQGGGEVLGPERDGTGRMVVVPGATGGTAGTLVLYLTRPVAAPRARALRQNVLSTSNRYETHDYQMFWHYTTWTHVTRFASFNYEVFVMLRSGQYLASASESLAGSLTVTSQGLTRNALFGEPATAYSAGYSRVLATH